MTFGKTKELAIAATHDALIFIAMAVAFVLVRAFMLANF